MTSRLWCSNYDPETNECMRRDGWCSCNPPRCYVCGRFARDWGASHAECEERIESEETADLRYAVESQGLVS